MFSTIRKRLTALYSGIMTVLLLTFVAATLLSLTWAIYWKEKQDVLLFAEEEAREQTIIMRHTELLEQLPTESYNQDGSGTRFAYVFDNNENLVTAEETYPAKVILDKIKNWHALYGQVVLVDIELPNGDGDVILMMVALPVVYGEERLGTIYVGKNITEYYRVFKTFVTVLTVMSLVFLLIASGGGYIMAGRAITPIKRSYEQQRQFVADASHELRTPLSVLMASVEAIQGDEDNNLSPFTRQVVGDMKDEIRQMAKIVGDMLTLARADTAVTNIFKEKFNLTPVIEQVVRTLQPLASEKAIQLRFACQDEVPIFADKERINQLLLILLDNGIKYTAARGAVQVEIESSVRTPGEVKIIVQDTGMGISKEHQKRIFERFYRADKARSREFGGTGLGLAIAKWIAEVHGGVIQVSSSEGQGSTFTVVLPQ